MVYIETGAGPDIVPRRTVRLPGKKAEEEEEGAEDDGADEEEDVAVMLYVRLEPAMYISAAACGECST
jgi:hypothetical protein